MNPNRQARVEKTERTEPATRKGSTNIGWAPTNLVTVLHNGASTGFNRSMNYSAKIVALRDHDCSRDHVHTTAADGNTGRASRTTAR